MSTNSAISDDHDLPHLVYVVTSPITANYLLRGQLRYMRERNWRVTLISSPGEALEDVARREGVQVQTVPMKREPSPFHDLISLVRLTRLMQKLRPDVVSCGTPKAGLLGAISSWLTRIPVRIYLLRGLRAENATGVMRKLFIGLEKLASRCSTHVFCVSHSLMQRAVEIGAIQDSRSIVVGQGSSNGVDTQRFAQTPESLQRSGEFRTAHGIDKDALVVGFVGRMVRDKGVPELVSAFGAAQKSFPGIRLLLVGPREANDDLPKATWLAIESDPEILWLGQTDDTPTVYAALDILVLPTHREGFPNVALEAAAAAKPLIVSTATGAIDSVVHGVTGLQFEVGNVVALTEALETYLGNQTLRIGHGLAGRERVKREFESQHVWGLYEQRYRNLLREATDR